jgi:hypothetical protein
MSYKYQAEMRGSINGSDVRISGSGLIDEVGGIVDGTYMLSAIPAGVDPLVFNSVLITGYPSVCQTCDGITNPFRPGSYSYSRKVDFGPHGYLEYTAECNETMSQDEVTILDSEFRINGSVTVPKLTGIEPLTECWIPAGQGRLDGEFLAQWLTSAGGHVTAIATTKYLLPKGNETPLRKMQRSIQLRNRLSPGMLRIHQQSSLLGSDDSDSSQLPS